ncbi:hypothetical protein Hanom_Chr10g00967161 [Helianthus anomalus]
MHAFCMQVFKKKGGGGVQVLFVLNRTEEKLINFRVECCEPLVFLGIRVVDPHVSTRGDNIELGVKNIYPMDHPVEPGHCEGCVTLILSNRVLASSNLLESTGDDEVGMVHGNKIGCKLRREMILFLKVLPVDVRVRVLGFLQGVGNGTLGDTQLVG